MGGKFSRKQKSEVVRKQKIRKQKISKLLWLSFVSKVGFLPRTSTSVHSFGTFSSIDTLTANH